MKKAITIENIIGSIEYITVIDGKESKPSYGAVWSTWNQNITKESEKFFGYKPEKEFDPVARENYQKYIAMAYYAGQIPAKIIETRTNEIGEDGCYIFTVETFGSLKLDEEAEEDGAKETETEAEPEQVTKKETAENPENESIKIHGLYSLTNCACLEVHIEEGYEPFVFWRMSCGEKCGEYDACYNCNGCKWHKAKIYDTAKGRQYFKYGKIRIYLDEVIRI